MTPRSDKKAWCSHGSLLAAEKITAVDRVVSLGEVILRNLVLFQTCRSGRDRGHDGVVIAGCELVSFHSTELPCVDDVMGLGEYAHSCYKRRALTV